MNPDSIREHCARLLLRRQKEVGSGGIGLLMACGCGVSDSVQRLHKRHRVLRLLAVAGLLGLCSAVGFAGARWWDGRGSSSLDLDFATALATQEQNSITVRKNAAGRVFYFAQKALEGLYRAEQSDPELAAFVQPLLAQLRHRLPDQKGIDAHIMLVRNPNADLADRLAGVQLIYLEANRVMGGLFDVLADPALAEAARVELRNLVRNATSQLSGS